MKWFIGCALLLLTALILESGLLAYSMYVLLGLLVLTRVMAKSWIENLTASRIFNHAVLDAGETVAVNVTIHNHGIGPVPWVILEDLLPAKELIENRARLSVKKKRMKIAMIGSKSSTILSYQIEFKMRGYYQIGPLVLETGDLFGLHRRYRVGTPPDFVLVYPKVIPMEGYELVSRRPIGEVRMTHRLFEDPTRIAGVRSYQSGDPLNRVHWRATARTGSLHCKIYEPSTIVGATILLDFHQAGYEDSREPFRSELAITAAASLAHAVYEMGQQVGLITNGRDAADRIRSEGWKGDFRTRNEAQESVGMQEKSDRLRPLIVETRRGVEQFQRIRETLARVELTDGLTLPQLITEASGRLPRDATIIAILGKADAETALALGTLRRRGFAVTAVLVNFDRDNLEGALAKLIAEGIETRQVKNEDEIAGFCGKQVQH